MLFASIEKINFKGERNMKHYLTPLVQVLYLNEKDFIRTSTDKAGKDHENWFGIIGGGEHI